MAEVIAKRDFRYQDDRTRQIVSVRRGEVLNVEHFTANRGDVEKMIRTGYAERPEALVVVPRKRGRPRKGT